MLMMFFKCLLLYSQSNFMEIITFFWVITLDCYRHAIQI